MTVQNRQRIYVIQKHAASALHYDLRLEMNGVLKSWAVPKEPSKRHSDKRLAISVDDHSLGYEKFEGVIPEGEYGAGMVQIWDSGTYELLENTPNKLVINIYGKVLQGEYCLIKLRPGSRADKNWLFFIKRPDRPIKKTRTDQKL